ncbi:Type III restriction enzyme, res subunit family protein [Tritrichomonas foetus]|uniref:Type III restriction enzyme, res subunit family protein n=1 Tax=Tritrichomonas foetus TaxID=1144522 RepID=A0A1J4JGU3_9EUKA|nr:Type III restriction enzyme, res subunit family protein [Tritrichomonas foetus]|eukprot:OHS96685.1 Type III restriction enzyme, res subunit family protein [Tritrichomonas foetus]
MEKMLKSRLHAPIIEIRPSNTSRPPRKIKKLRHTQKTERIIPIEYITNAEFTEARIPPFLQNSYLIGQPPPRITSLRDWQRDLFLSKEWKENRSSIVLVPTSGGKTLAADVAIAQQLASDENSKIIYALPFVSLASEKTNEFRFRFPDFHVRPFYQNVGGHDFRRGSIAICTYEKVHSLLNCAIKDNYIEKFKTVIIDEIHMIGEGQRGAIIEAMIVKLLLLRPRVDIRIIGLTATLNKEDANRLSCWINGFTHFCAARPSRIKHYYKGSDGQLFLNDGGNSKRVVKIQSIAEDVKHILSPIRNSLKQHPSSTVLVFVNTRKQTVTVAKFIAHYLYSDNLSTNTTNTTSINPNSSSNTNINSNPITNANPKTDADTVLTNFHNNHSAVSSPLPESMYRSSNYINVNGCNDLNNINLPILKPPDRRMQSARDFLVQRLSRTETGLDASLGECVKNGVAFHHAGMLLEERKLIEDAARDSTISVIVATTTLSAGINIRSVARVIIYDMYRMGPNRKRQLIPAAVYTQMAGRAGRDESQGGDVFVLGQFGDEQEKNDALKLSTQKLDDVQPQLLQEGISDRFFLQCLAAGLLPPEDGALKFVETCLESFINGNEERNKEIAEKIKERLRKYSLIMNDSDVPTSLGQAIAGSSLSIEEGLELKASINRLQTNLCLRDEVHLLYLCVPPSAVSMESTPSYESDIWHQLHNEHKDVFKLITTMDGNGLERHIILTIQNGGKRMNRCQMEHRDRELDRFFYACLLQKLIAEKSVNEIVSFFGVTRGSVQALQMQAATFAGQSVRFCETTGCQTLGKALNTFRERLNFGVKNELLPLMKLQSCNRYIARILVTNRIPSPIELSELDEEEIARILASKRNADSPSEKELEIAKRLKSESRKVARSLLIIDELQSNAFSRQLNDIYGRKKS